MDVICKNGKHFRDLQVAKECANSHPGGCGQCEGIDWYSSPKETSPLADETQSKITRRDNNTQQPKKNQNQDECPLHKTQVFPCPRCCYSKSISEMKEFLKTTTWWFCKYPNIVNLSMLQPEDIIGKHNDI